MCAWPRGTMWAKASVVVAAAAAHGVSAKKWQAGRAVGAAASGKGMGDGQTRQVSQDYTQLELLAAEVLLLLLLVLVLALRTIGTAAACAQATLRGH